MVKVALVVDGLNIVKAAEKVGKRVDFAMLLRVASDHGRRDVLFKHFYIGPPVDGAPATGAPATGTSTAGAPKNGRHEILRREVEGMGYTWVCCQSPGSRPGRPKSSVDLMLVMDMLTWALAGRVDVICLAGGDGDYAAAVHRIRQMGVKVCLLGVADSGHVSRDLLNEVAPGDFCDLARLGALRPA